MPGRTGAQISDSYSHFECVYTSVVGSDNRGANIYGRPQISGSVLCVTREWKSRADLHGTEGIEFHDGCFFILLSGVCAAIGWNLNNKSRQIVNGAACARVCSR